MKNNVIETRKSEVRFSTSDPKEMFGKYLAKRLLRTWNEDFVDEDTGEVVSIERNEIIASVGKLIDNDVLAEIQFFMQSGDIKTVEVSNQKREATLVWYAGLVPWSVTAQINKKKHRFLLYASSINMALEIAKDYIELNFSGSFQLLQAKGFNDCIILRDALKKVEETEDESQYETPVEKKFYQIEMRVEYNDSDRIYTFVVHTKDVDSAMLVINNWISSTLKERHKECGESEDSFEYKTSLESAVVIPCSRTIERDFSLAYKNESE